MLTLTILLFKMNKKIKFNDVYYIIYLFGDWGLGIGDWAQSPIPNPQSPILINKL